MPHRGLCFSALLQSQRFVFSLAMTEDMMGTFKATWWNTDSIEYLIELYEKEELLWKGTHKDYHKKDIRKAALARISETMQVKVDEVIKKITNLRTYYNKEWSKTRKSEGTDEIYRSKWPFYEILDAFLRDRQVKSRGMSKWDSESEDCCEDEERTAGKEDTDNDDDANQQKEDDNDSQIGRASTPASSLPTPASSLPKYGGKRKAKERYPGNVSKKRSCVKAGDALVSEASSTLRTIPRVAMKSEHKEDEDDTYGRYIANEMRGITNPCAKQLIKLKMQTLLFEARYGGLTFGAGVGAFPAQVSEGNAPIPAMYMSPHGFAIPGVEFATPNRAAQVAYRRRDDITSGSSGGVPPKI